jgi:hypothetical protein
LQEWLEVPPDYERLEGLKHIEGTTEPIDGDMFTVFGKEKLRLDLEDGGRLYFFLTNPSGAIPNADGRGLHRPDA